jgi:hypothetical protein
MRRSRGHELMSGRKAKAARKAAKHPATDHPAFERHDEVKEMADLADVLIPCESWNIVEWHPLPHGEGRPTQVHIVITPHDEFNKVIGVEAKFLMRLKSKDACDAMIAVLQSHRNNVWGDT